jgi:hypothetical protein
MVTMIVLAILLTINMLLMHLEIIGKIYISIYRKLIKPKFKLGELVLINDVEFEIVMISKNAKPYTYFCLPVYNKTSRMLENYYHESEIKKKTGLLKELE